MGVMISLMGRCQANFRSEVMDRRNSAELARDQEYSFEYPVVAPKIDDLFARVPPAGIMERFRKGELGSHYPADLYDRDDDTAFGQTVGDTYRLAPQSSAFKRCRTCPLVIVSNRALGFDLWKTIINYWRPHWKGRQPRLTGVQI